MPPPPPDRPMHYLITGAARGIVRHLTRTLISRGHRVFLLDASSVELSQTLSLLSQIPTRAPKPPALSSDPAQRPKPQYLAHECDLRDRGQIVATVKAVERFFEGRLDCLVNNAMALPHVMPYGDEDGICGKVGGKGNGVEEDEVMRHWDAQVAVGLTAPFLLSRLCVPMLRRDGKAGGGGTPGCIVNISSTRANQAEMDHEGYSAVKAGLLGLTQSMAVSIGHRTGVRVNALVLGWINVANECKEGDEKGVQWEDGLTDEDHGWHLNGRVGRGEDVMRALDFLVESEFVTGESVTVSGGVERRMVYPE